VDEIKNILKSNDVEKIRALFAFTVHDTNELILLKFNLWTRFFFPKFFFNEEAPFHKQIDEGNLDAYRGIIKSFTDIVFRGGAKTTRTKLFIAFCIANDKGHFRRYYKVLTKDIANSKQIVTDIYNMFVDKRCKEFYPEIFAKTDAKRQESMNVFDTATGIKMIADTVGVDQRGQIQENSRPDFILLDDFETRVTLRSAVVTKALWDNIEEARTGLAKGGACVYNCNYLSERGNVHKIVEKKNEHNRVLIVPIIENNIPAWSIYSLADIESIKQDADDFEGEYLCKPSASKDVLFDRTTIDEQVVKPVLRTINGLKIYKELVSGHRYASGHDVAGGVGLDSSTSVFIDFEQFPAQVVATYADNTIKPDVFGDEIYRQSSVYGYPLIAPEKNNHGHATIARLRQLDADLYVTQRKDVTISLSSAKEYGWHTNGVSKPKMLFALAKAVSDGHLQLNDPDLIAECRSYTRNDLMDKDDDVRLTTRHFDLLIACAIAWQMKDFATYHKPKEMTDFEVYESRLRTDRASNNFSR
jgi:hypothetical protein